jgi:hypothetical protein
VRRAALLTLLVAVAGIFAWLLVRGYHGTKETGKAGKSTSPDPTSEVIPEVSTVEEPIVGPETGPETTRLIGEILLEGYADPAQPPQQDLILMSRLIDNFQLLVKNAAERPLSANEEWADALRGGNPARARFLPDNHVALNEQGQVVDRWGTPLFFHAVGDQRFEIRSGGPDRKMWSEDDIHLSDDGSFRRGEELQEASLFGTESR